MPIISGIAVVPVGSVSVATAPSGVASSLSDLENAASHVGPNGSATATVADQSMRPSGASTWSDFLVSLGMRFGGQLQESANAEAKAESSDIGDSQTFKAGTVSVAGQSMQTMKDRETVHLRAEASSEQSTRATFSPESNGNAKAKPRSLLDVGSSASAPTITQQSLSELSIVSVTPSPVPEPLEVSTAKVTNASCGADEGRTTAPAIGVIAIASSVQVSRVQAAVTSRTNTDVATQQLYPVSSIKGPEPVSEHVITSTHGLEAAVEVAESDSTSTFRQSGAVTIEDARAARKGPGTPTSIALEKTSDVALNSVHETQHKSGNGFSEITLDSTDANGALQHNAPLANSLTSEGKGQTVAIKQGEGMPTQLASPTQESAGPTFAHTVSHADISAPSSAEMKGSLSNRSQETLNGSSACTALDSGHESPNSTWIATSPRTVEAGYHDSSLGWVSVRAQADATGVHATVIPVSADAAQSLSTHLSELTTYLSEHRTPIDSVTIDTSGMSVIEQSLSNGGQAQSEQQRGGSGTMLSNSSEVSTGSVSEGSELNDTAAPIPSAGGTYISVRV